MLIPVPHVHRRLADRVAVMQDGRFLEQGSTYEVLMPELVPGGRP